MPSSSSDSPNRLLRASEVGQWTYCQRAWWLAREGCENRNTAALEAGITIHAHHGRGLAQAQRARLIALALLASGVILFLAGLAFILP